MPNKKGKKGKSNSATSEVPVCNLSNVKHENSNASQKREDERMTKPQHNQNQNQKENRAHNGGMENNNWREQYDDQTNWRQQSAKDKRKTGDDRMTSRVTEQDRIGYVLFYQGGSVFSQWHPANFTVDGVEYNCTEQFMMHQKAVLMRDWESADYILTLRDPRKQKEAGRNVQFWDQKLWDGNCYELVKRGNIAKFSQNSNMRRELLETYPKTIVEANPYDRIWGIGLEPDHPNARFQLKWKGKNLLGYILTEVRDQLMKDGGTVPKANAAKPLVGSQQVNKGSKGGASNTNPATTSRAPLDAAKNWFDEASSTSAQSSLPTDPPFTSSNEFFIDIKTTNADKNSSIVQIAVLGPPGVYSHYVVPSKQISKDVQEKTGISKDGNQVLVSGRKVEAVNIKEALLQLLDFFGDEPIMLIGYNMKNLGCHVLIEEATRVGLSKRFNSVLTEMLDLNTLASKFGMCEGNTTIEKLSQQILGNDRIIYDAKQDVKIIQEMFRHLNIDEETRKDSLFTYQYVINARKYIEEKSRNLEGWKPIIAKGVPKKVAEKAAGNGISVETLKELYDESGEDKVKEKMKEITDKKEHLRQLCLYLKQKN